MSFRFFCPQGHILEAKLDQVGHAAACPFCGTPMIIPSPKGPPGKPIESTEVTDAPAQKVFAQESALSFRDGQLEPAVENVPSGTLISPESGFQVAPHFDESATTGSETRGLPTETLGDRESEVSLSEGASEVFHIPCPLGHVLETPREMLGREAMCPFCQSVFRLEYEASQEYAEKRRKAMELADRRAALLWIRLAILATIVVLGGLIAMIILAPK